MSVFDVLQDFSRLGNEGKSGTVTELTADYERVLEVMPAHSVSIFTDFRNSISTECLLPVHTEFVTSFYTSQGLGASDDFSASTFASTGSFDISLS